MVPSVSNAPDFSTAAKSPVPGQIFRLLAADNAYFRANSLMSEEKDADSPPSLSQRGFLYCGRNSPGDVTDGYCQKECLQDFARSTSSSSYSLRKASEDIQVAPPASEGLAERFAARPRHNGSRRNDVPAAADALPGAASMPSSGRDVGKVLAALRRQTAPARTSNVDSDSKCILHEVRPAMMSLKSPQLTG